MSSFPSCRFFTCVCPHLSARAIPYIRGLPSQALRACYKTLHAMLPRSLSRSLLLSLALCEPCAPRPLSVRPPSHAHGTQQCAGHPHLLVPRPCLPFRARCIATLGAHRPLCCSACRCPPSPLCLCLVPSSSLSPWARTVPSFPLLLYPTPSPSVPLLSGHHARQFAVRHSPFLSSGRIHPRLFGRLPGPLLASCFTELC